MTMAVEDLLPAVERDVSRETRARLERLLALVADWNPRINLISPSTLGAAWQRHVLDSVQVYPLGAPRGLWLDIGSGGGFPGLVVAILAQDRGAPIRLRLVESDQRKAVFLREALRELEIDAEVVADRAERIPGAGAATLSCRALGDLDMLLELAMRHLEADGVAVFPRGGRWRAELSGIRARWTFDVAAHQSLTNAASAILVFRNIGRR